MKPAIEILADADQLAHEAAERIVQLAEEAIEDHGHFTLALAGGHTPEKTYELLAAYPLRDQIDWLHTWLLFGDERFVPHADARSNYSMVRRTLLEPLEFDDRRVLPINTDDMLSAAAAAVLYQLQLARLFEIEHNGSPPTIDLILLGLGDDGHTASLFPGAAALQETKRWTIESPPGVLPPPVDRVTFTFATLNAARHVMFLVAGANKAEAVRDVLENHAPVARRPAAGVRPEYGTLTWLLDEAAASLLKR